MLTAAQKLEMGNHTPVENLGKYLNKKRGLLKCVWNFADQGGAVGAILLLDDDGKPAILPSKAIITQVYIDVVTAMTSTSNDGTIALGANTGVDLLAAVDADTLSGVVAGIPVGTAATMVKLTAARQITLTVAVHALLTGKINVFVEYALSE